MHSLHDIQSLVQQTADAWIAADLDAIAAPFAAEGWFISPGGTWQGPSAIRNAAADFFGREQGVRIRIDRLIWDADNGQGAVEWVWSAIDSEGRRYVDEDSVIFTINQAGEITYWREYFNLTSREYSDDLELGRD